MEILNVQITLNDQENEIKFLVPKNVRAGLVNNQKENYCYTFSGILSPESKQDEVFERVARKVVTSSIEGMNGTIFAYGQVLNQSSKSLQSIVVKTSSSDQL